MVIATLSRFFNNKALLFGFGSKGISLFVGVINIVLVTTYFSSSLQGFYYTFYNLLIFQTLLDMGFGIVLIQFLSHEWAFLHFTANGDIDGESSSKNKFGALIRLSLKWYALVSVVFLLVVGSLGYFFLGSKNSGVHFEIPWLVLCLSVSLSILIVPFKYFLEGSNQMGKSQKILFYSTLVSGIATWAAILLGADLYTAVITSFSGVLVTFFLLIRESRPFISLSKLSHIKETQLWKGSFFSQQWKIAVSWFAGYIMFQSFIPIAFKTLSPVEAGKVGAIMTLFNAVFQIGLISVNVVLPQMGILSAKKEFLQLDALAHKTLKRCLFFSASTFLAAMAVLIAGNMMHLKQMERLTDITTAIFFLLPGIVLQFCSVETYIIRFQKKEPFVFSSIICAILMVISNFTLGHYFGLLGIAVGFTLVTSLVLVPWTHIIYKKEIRKFTIE